MAVKEGIKSASAIYKHTNIQYVEVHRHLLSLTDAGQVTCRQVHNRPRGKALFNEYDFVRDYENLIELYGDMQTKMPVPESAFLCKMLGYTKVEPAKNGRVYTEQDFNRIKREKKYESWTPKTKKRIKNHVSGGTLLWF